MSNFKRKTRNFEFRQNLWWIQGHKCAWCEVVIPFEDIGTQLVDLDHWVPLIHKKCGGKDIPENMRIMHKECNNAKDDLCPTCDGDQFWAWKSLREVIS
jgi:5-methylcytosine-specific restriction endonuclease McrA